MEKGIHDCRVLFYAMCVVWRLEWKNCRNTLMRQEWSLGEKVSLFPPYHDISISATYLQGVKGKFLRRLSKNAKKQQHFHPRRLFKKTISRIRQALCVSSGESQPGFFQFYRKCFFHLMRGHKERENIINCPLFYRSIKVTKVSNNIWIYQTRIEIAIKLCYVISCNQRLYSKIPLSSQINCA